jgi:hypothetical protein
VNRQTLAGAVAIVALAISALLWAFDPLSMFVAGWYALVGGLLVLRRPDNIVSWLLLLVAFGFVATTTPLGIDLPALRAGSASLDDFVPVWISSLAGGMSFAAFTTLTLVFPSGRLWPGRWRRAALALLVVQVVLVALSAIAPVIRFNADGSATVEVPNRFAVLPELPFWTFWSVEAAMLVVILGMVTGAASLVVRYRRSSGVERLQLRWLTAACAAVVVTVAFGLGSLAIFGADAWFAWAPALAALPFIPIAIGIAVLRYRLYDIDVVIRRTLVYGVVVGILASVYVALVLGLQTALAWLIGEGTLPVAISTLVIAALFGPVRARVRTIVDRRFYRSRYDAQRTVEAFATRLRDEVDVEAVGRALEDASGLAVQPASVVVWLRKPAS